MSLIRNPRVLVMGAICLIVFGGGNSANLRSAKRPILVVGTDNAPPYYSVAPDGSITGVAVDVLRRAAFELDFDLRFVHFSGVPDSFLRSHQADLWPVLAITKERQEEFHMTKPWVYNTFCLLHLSDKPVPTGFALHLATWSNPITARKARMFFPQSQLSMLNSREDVMRSVCSGKIDAGLIEIRVLDSLLLARPPGCEGANLARQSIPDAAFPMAIASVKSAANQVDQLHRQITKMAGTGELGAIFDKWSSITSNEANSIVAMNAAQQRTRFAYVAGVIVLIASTIVVWHSRRVRKAFDMARREMTERKRAEVAHRNADRVRNMVLEGAGEGICGLDAQGRTTFLNSTAAKLLGFGSSGPEGQDFHALVHGPDLSPCVSVCCSLFPTEDCMKEVSVDTGVFRRRDGAQFPVEFICSPLLDEGVYVGSVISFSDITERRRAELLDRDRNAVLEMLAENESLEHIFEAIARLVERQYAGFFCAIASVAEDRLELRAAPTLPPALLPTLEAIQIGPDAQSSGLAAFWSKPVIVPDISSNLLWQES